MIDETRELRELKNELHELRLDMIKTETRLLFWIYGIAAFVMVVSFTLIVIEFDVAGDELQVLAFPVSCASDVATAISGAEVERTRSATRTHTIRAGTGGNAITGRGWASQGMLPVGPNNPFAWIFDQLQKQGFFPSTPV